MKVQKIVRAQGEFAKIGTDIKDGDSLVIQDDGQVIAGDFGDRHVFKVATTTGVKNLSFNQTSMNNLIDAYGDDTSKWVDKSATAYVVKQMVGDGLKNVCYLVGEGFKMRDDGKFERVSKVAGTDVEYPAGPNPDDVPF